MTHWQDLLKLVGPIFTEKSKEIDTIRDNNGLSGLDAASNNNHWVTKYLLWKCKWSTIEVIEAYENVSLHMPSSLCFDFMSRATSLRMEKGFPKVVSQPLECYGFIKEWETMEELEGYRYNPEMLGLQCALAHERIFAGQHESVLFAYNYISGK